MDSAKSQYFSPSPSIQMTWLSYKHSHLHKVILAIISTMEEKTQTNQKTTERQATFPSQKDQASIKFELWVSEWRKWAILHWNSTGWCKACELWASFWRTGLKSGHLWQKQIYTRIDRKDKMMSKADEEPVVVIRHQKEKVRRFITKRRVLE